MWRFLHNIPRALKNYHAPRASVGIYVENDDKDQDACSKNQASETQDQAVQQHTSCVLNQRDFKERGILWRLATQRGQSHTANQQHEDQDDENRTNQEDQDNQWHYCPKDIWAFLQGSNRMLEAFVVGSGLLWTASHNKRNNKSDLVYRVLFSVSDKDAICDKNTSITADVGLSAPSLEERVWDHRRLAIKDAEGSAQDGAINKSKSETIEAALKEFESLCCDYTAQNESLLGLVAADKNKMSEAVEHFHLSCSMGNKTACYNLGLCYETGWGVLKDLDKAKQFYTMAAKKGHPQAMYNLSLLYLEQGGDGKKTKGLHYMEMAARAGLAQAQTYMGIHQMEEVGDARKAAAYFKAAADQNDREAQFLLGLCHELGLGLEVNECRAAHLYSKAASKGHDGAMFNLGTFYEKGLGGIPGDLGTAIELYRKAAKMGNENAKNRMEELKSLQEKEEQKAIEDQQRRIGSLVDDCVISPHHPGSGSLPSMHSSLSSPNLPLTDSPLSGLVYQTFNVTNHSTFDPGGVRQDKVHFYIDAKDENDKEIPKIGVSKRNTHPSAPVLGEVYPCSKTFAINAVRKSSTNPDFSSFVACNI